MEQPNLTSAVPSPPADARPSHLANGGRSARMLDQQMSLSQQISRRFAGFLSHSKREAGTEARLVQNLMREILPSENNEIFLDSDDLNDLRLLLEHVKSSDVVVLLQTRGVLTRPWVILELYTAILNHIPIVALNTHNAFEYDYGAAVKFLLHFDQEIDIANPEAATLLLDQGVDPVDVAYRLSNSLPYIISTDIHPNGSSRQIKASLEDLVDTMQRAVPIEPSLSRSDWLAKRATQETLTPKQTLHNPGNGVGRETGAEAAAAPLSLARVPDTVPELPSSYIIRNSDIDALKSVLLTNANEAQNPATKMQQTKIGAHGMGGVGKTTVAVALVNDEQVLASFDKIAWVSVGHKPDVEELHGSIYYQLTDQELPDNLKTNREVMSALHNAALGLRVLLVLDDVWDPAVEKELSCVDPNTSSRVLVTTRVRGLLKNAPEIELGVLSPGDALKLLLSSADIQEEETDPESHCIAVEIVELCGRLPLTLAIAGGTVADHLDGLTPELLALFSEGYLREAEDDEADGRSLEERIIASSLKMIKSKNKDQVEKVFLFFAIFPEDVPVPATVFNVLTPLLSTETNPTKAKIMVGNCLSTLLKYNLLKGSLTVGSPGIFMHDIVRDFVINRHSAEELRALQRTVVDTILAARPTPDGFPPSAHAAPNTFEGYVARQIFSHFRGSLQDGEKPPDAWLAHPDLVIKANVAVVVGLEALSAFSETPEASWDLVRASIRASRRLARIKEASSDPAQGPTEQAEDMGAGVVKQEWDTLFADLDIDNSGSLTKEEILQRLRTADDDLLDRFSDILRLPKKINWRDGTKAKFEKAWKEMDADSDREVSLRDFRLYCRQFLVDEGIVKEEWDELFKDLDTDNSGTLTKKEVLKRLSTADDDLLDRFSDILQLPTKLSMMDGSKRKLEKAWKEMDVDGDKEVTLKEFRIFCRKFLVDTVEGGAEER